MLFGQWLLSYSMELIFVDFISGGVGESELAFDFTGPERLERKREAILGFPLDLQLLRIA